MARPDDDADRPSPWRRAAVILAAGGWTFWVMVLVVLWCSGLLSPRRNPATSPAPPPTVQRPESQPARPLQRVAAAQTPAQPTEQATDSPPSQPPPFVSGPTAEGRALVRQLYRELEEFHATPRFREYGLARQREWLERAKRGQRNPRYSFGEKEACGMLMTMASEYIESGGQETKYTRWARPHVERAIAGLNPEP